MNPEPRRLFVREAGWQVGHKTDSMREFCYMTAPGQDFYHRLDAGELFLYRGDERLCIPCAERRGLLAHEPRRLRDPMDPIELEVDPSSASQSLELADGREA